MGLLTALAALCSVFVIGLGLWTIVKVEESLDDIDFDAYDDCAVSGCEGDCGCC